MIMIFRYLISRTTFEYFVFMKYNAVSGLLNFDMVEIFDISGTLYRTVKTLLI